MSDLIAIGYRDVSTANAAREKIIDLQRQGLITVRDAAVVDVAPDGKVRVHQAASATGVGATSGALWGGLIGLLFFAPFLGMAVGAGAGALAGKATDVGVDDKFMKDLGATLQPGTAALFLLIDQVTVDKVMAEMAPHQFGGQLLRSSLSVEAEQRLRDAVDALHLAPA
ncbi:DUF1269 domain-containing protein [Dactylosporangium roseum]|uniref:DUF1269 domain-containing protein n=1 Tax=Dactylosporangium roseum TaxID=47989 RepID=A0ABY5YXF9_9ACTN|nr:DUF1269 domain-containing protein [Dactylosporangium roseum]UWZ34217.1 DUF1269 domain-containing protein [Dactylosporangium roseum]